MRQCLLILGFLSVTSFAGTPATMEIAAGDNQSAFVGNAVPGVVCVVVKDAGGAAVPGVTVTWGSVTGGGNISGATQVTGSSGIATLGGWTLGTVPGANTITCTSAGINSVTFNATAVAGPVTKLTVAAGDNQTAIAGSAVANPITVMALDPFNNAVPGVSVTFGSVTGGGSITGGTQTTDANGQAALGSWTLGKALGKNTLTASATGAAPILISATAVAGPATQLLIAAGNNQSAEVGSPVSDVVCAAVRDANNLPISGVTVTWGNVTRGGSITGETQITDANGIVTLGSWTLGPTPGENTITATALNLAPITFIAHGVAAGSGDNNIVIQWDNALLQAIKNTKTTPPIAARAMAIVHTAIFDAWAAYDAVAIGTQLGGTLRRPEAERTAENKQIAISYAAYRTLTDLFPTQKIVFDGEMTTLQLDPLNTSTDATTAAGVGNSVASAIIMFRHSDGSNQLGDQNPGAYSDYTSYAPVNDPDTLNDPSRWQPLRLANGTVQVFLTPQWGVVTPFAIGSSEDRKKLMPKACATYPGKNYEKQAQEIVDLSANLDDRTKSIALYWADGGGTVTPPGHWCKFAQFVSARDKHTLDDDVKFFFALSNALFDASIEVWDCKRKFDSVRPITAIRFLNKAHQIKSWGGPGQGTQTINGEDWQSYIATPAFGEYVSGHSTFSAAGAQILRAFSRSDTFNNSAIVPASSSIVEANTPAQDITLSWKRFSDAANEAGMSRRYGGIHFKDGDLNGRKLGKKIGVLAWKKSQGYISGKVKP